MSEPDDGYAFDPDEEETGDDLESSRLPLLIAIALVVLAAFAGVVWLAYTQGVEEGRSDVPRVASTPTRAAPAKPHAVASNPYSGLNIYQSPTSADAQETKPTPPAATASAAAANSQPVFRPSANATAEKPAPASQVGESERKPAPPPASVAPKRVSAPPPATLARSIAPPAEAPAIAAPATEAPAAAATAGVMLQIGSYKSDAEARQSWNAFKAHHAIAAAFAPDVKEADLGAKGVWYRLRIGTFEDRRTAAAFCEKLKAQGASCIVSR